VRACVLHVDSGNTFLSSHPVVIRFVRFLAPSSRHVTPPDRWSPSRSRPVTISPLGDALTRQSAIQSVSQTYGWLLFDIRDRQSNWQCGLPALLGRRGVGDGRSVVPLVSVVTENTFVVVGVWWRHPGSGADLFDDRRFSGRHGSSVLPSLSRSPSHSSPASRVPYTLDSVAPYEPAMASSVSAPSTVNRCGRREGATMSRRSGSWRRARWPTDRLTGGVKRSGEIEWCAYIYIYIYIYMVTMVSTRDLRMKRRYRSSGWGESFEMTRHQGNGGTRSRHVLTS